MAGAHGADGTALAQQRDAMAVGLAYLFGAGALLVLLTLALPHRDETSEIALATVAAAALGVSGALLARGRGRAPALYAWTVTLGATMIGMCLWWGGPSGRAYATLYVWVALYAFYFFSPRLALAIVAWSFATHVLVLQARDVSPVPWVDGTMVLGTSLVAGTLIGRLVAQVRGRAADLDSAASLANAMTAEPDVSWARDAICTAVRDACHADAAVLVEGSDASASAGDAELALALAARPGVQAAHGGGEPVALGREATRPFEPHVEGLAQPVLRDGVVVAVLVVGWRTPLRVLGDRATTAASLFAAEAAVVLEREERLSGERERRALEINDSIVQGLVVAKYALAAGREGEGSEAVGRTLERARALMDGQLDLGRPDGPSPGDLRRDAPGTLTEG